MSAFVSRLSVYGDYHRDHRNIATHLVGIPMIVFAVGILTSRPALGLGEGLVLTPAMLISLLTGLFYLRLDLRFGAVMTALLALHAWAGLALAALPTAAWLELGLALFVLGWAIQFLGHHYEGRKPAFVDDLTGLVIGPLFVAAEVAFKLGLRLEVKAAMDADAARRGAGLGAAG